MPDTKITALTAIGANPIIPATFPIPMVDLTDTSMAASGTTKKVTVNQILGAGGTATLASATITGDLTVDTNVLKVNTTTNRVGINTTTPTQNLQITGSGDPLTVDGCSAIKLTNTVSGRAAIVGIDDSQNFVIWNVGTEVSETIKFLTGGGSGKEQYRITHGGVFNWYDGAGGTRMTLNATGLGVGVSPAYKLDVNGSANVSSFLRIGTNPASSGDIRLPNNSLIVGRNAANSANLVMMQLDSSNALKLNEGSITIDGSANTIVYVTATAPTIANSNMVFNLISNTNLRISVRGTDGTLRTANITLA